MENIVSAAKTDVFRVRINPESQAGAGIRVRKERSYLDRCHQRVFPAVAERWRFPFAVTEDNAEIIKAKALSRLTRQLQEAQDDPVSYSEDEVYKMFGVEK